jgi:hypothetical protein
MFRTFHRIPIAAGFVLVSPPALAESSVAKTY